ncbi:MAG: SMP-30/gluconolactonase/LRE family protein [Hyphomonas sp.]|nr:SMP-30/gluconolactonase/LRE family protein [Hyphomonas sp.]
MTQGIDHRLLAEGLRFPEGPCIGSDGSIWWVEIEGGCLCHLANRKVVRHTIGGRPNGAAMALDGDIWIADQGLNAIRHFRVNDGSAKTILDRVDGQRLGMPNDLTFSPDGELLFTCSNDARTSPVGYVCALSLDSGKARIIADGLYFPNGIALSPDCRRLYVAETFRQRIMVAERTNDDWSDFVPFAMVGGPIGPDGLAVCDDGAIFVALYGQGCVMKLSAQGERLETIVVPDEKPTNLALDPTGTLGLVVTLAGTGTLLAIARPESPASLPPGFVQ